MLSFTIQIQVQTTKLFQWDNNKFIVRFPDQDFAVVKEPADSDYQMSKNPNYFSNAKLQFLI